MSFPVLLLHILIKKTLLSDKVFTDYSAQIVGQFPNKIMNKMKIS